MEECTDAYVEELRQAAARRGTGVEFGRLADGGLAAESHGKIIKFSVHNFFYSQDLIEPGVFEYFFETLEQSEAFPQIIDVSKPRYHKIRGHDLTLWVPSIPEGWHDAQCYVDYLKPKAGETVLDFGAYAGLSAILFAEAVGKSGKVFSFEPDPICFEALKRNTGKFENIAAYDIAVSGHEGCLQFSAEGAMGSRIISDCDLNRGRLITVNCRTLEQIHSDVGEDVHIVKMDVEGAEYDIFENVGDALLKYPARWMLEIHRNQDGLGEIDVGFFRRKFERNGYMTFQLTAPDSDYLLPLIYAEPKFGR